ncbi:MAG: glucokinase [Deltaproteobacteria bacterium]
MILAGDVGGTKTNLARFRVDGGRLVREGLRSFPSREYGGLEQILGEYLAGGPPVESVCIGVAGPVVAGRSRVTNLPWEVDRESVRRACRAKSGFLINDLQATACAVPFLPPESLATLQEGGADPEGTVAVLAAGTGLGVSFLVWDGSGYLPVASEAGHADFPARNRREERLRSFLAGEVGRVSVERVVSGPGLHAIHRFLREVEGMGETEAVGERMAREDPSRVISEEGLSGRSATCREALRIFCSLYGATAGNLALQVFSTGGVFLGGGIAPAILPALSDGEFLEAFLSKGRFRELLSRLPVRVIRDDKAALLGAARYAQAKGGGGGWSGA